MSTELKIPVVAVEIFRGPAFVDDNFVNGWVPVGSTGFSTDGDICTVTPAGGDGNVIKTFANPIDTTAYPYLEIRVASVGSIWGVMVYDGTSWISVFSAYATPGLFEATLPSGKQITKIMLQAWPPGYPATFDYVFISAKSMLQPGVDLSETAEIVQPLLEMGVSSAKLSIPNNDASYTGLISEFDRIIIWLYRQGDTMKKQFGGIISDYTYRGRQRDFWIDLDCLGLGRQLHAPETLLQKQYSAVNGKTIILDALALCSQLTNKFVDVDGDLASTHSVIYDEVLPYQVITEICKKATTLGGVVGFDGYVDPAGNLHVFATGKYTNAVSLANQHYERPINAHRIRNKQTVYGANKKLIPPTGDDWTESLSGWTVDNGTLALEGSIKKVGSYSLHMQGLNGISAQIHRTFPAVWCGSSFRKQFSNLIFWLKYSNTQNGLIFTLYAPDASNYFQFWLVNGLATMDWTEITLALGQGGTQPDVSYGNPDWNNIQGVLIHSNGNIGTTQDIYIDWLHFGPSNYNGVSSNSVSIAKYGTQWNDDQTDDTLQTDAECTLKAQSLIDFLKAPIEALTLTVDGDNGFVPGDKQRVIISNDSLDAYFRIMEIRHIIDGVAWDTVLKLSNEPKLMDYIFASANAPRYAGATIVIPRDFSTIQQGINALVVT